MKSQRQSPTLIGFCLRSVSLFGIGIFAGVIIALGFFEWDALAYLGFVGCAFQEKCLWLITVAVFLVAMFLYFSSVYYKLIAPSKLERLIPLLQQCKAEYKEVRSAVSVKSAELETCIKKVEDGEIKLKGLQEDQTHLSQQIAESEALISERKDELQHLQQSCKDLQSQQGKLERKVEKLSADLKSKRKDRTALKKEIKGLEADRGKLLEKKEALESDVLGLEDRKGKLPLEIETIETSR